MQNNVIAFIALGPDTAGKVSLNFQAEGAFKHIKPHVQQAWDEGCAAFLKAFSARMNSDILRLERAGRGQDQTDAALASIISKATLVVEEK